MSQSITQYSYRPVVLIVLDGWGIAAPGQGNAITQANTPFFDSLVKEYTVFTLLASGEAVGLPRGEMGNSEVGHLNMGAGSIIYHDLPRINQSIAGGDFFEHDVFLKAIEHARGGSGHIHLMGLVSTGGVHSSIEHAYALLELCEKSDVEIYLHVFLDGRDTPFNSGKSYVQQVEKWMREHGRGHIATISGRYWAMDRDRRWDRTQAAYDAIARGKSHDKDIPSFQSAVQAIDYYYSKEVFDEEIPPTVILDAPEARVSDGDSVVFFNFRPDRARQLTQVFVDSEFDGFERSLLKNLLFVTMTQYDPHLPVHVAFPPSHIDWPLARVVSEAGLTQFHIAETEKYAHVTYFIDGGHEEGFDREEKALVPSPKVSQYDEKPEMSAREITDRVEQELDAGTYDFYTINYANADMVGHTGNLQATIQALEVLDECIRRIVEKVVSLGGAMVITADHGNAEGLINPTTGEINKEHSTSPVPCIVIGQQWKVGDIVSNNDLYQIKPSGVLGDVAPTVLKILGLEVPSEMKGRSLV